MYWVKKLIPCPTSYSLMIPVFRDNHSPDHPFQVISSSNDLLVYEENAYADLSWFRFFWMLPTHFLYVGWGFGACTHVHPHACACPPVSSSSCLSPSLFGYTIGQYLMLMTWIVFIAEPSSAFLSYLCTCLVFCVNIAVFFPNNPTALSNTRHFLIHLCSLYTDFSFDIHQILFILVCVFIPFLLLNCQFSGISGGRKYRCLWSFSCLSANSFFIFTSKGGYSILKDHAPSYRLKKNTFIYIW